MLNIAPSKIENGITPSSFETVMELSEVEFLVPLYQRLFVWEEEQISQLFNDLYQASQKDAQAPYYIGTLTVHLPPNEAGRWVLVDGQQRMTVLALLGACMDKDAGGSLWKPFLEREKSHENRLHYFARKKDQKDLDTIIRDGTEAKEKIGNANMKRFIGVFDRFINGLDGGRAKSAFNKFVYEKATALVSFLPESYGVNDLNLYFEKMNAAGKQLEAHEILKVRYFGGYSARWNAVADGSEGYPPSGTPKAVVPSQNETCGDKLTLENLLEKGGELTDTEKKEPDREEIESDSSRLVMSFPVFLLHVLSIVVGKELENNIPGFWNPKNLLSTFQSTYKKTWEHNGGSSKKFVEAMEEYRTWMDKWIVNVDGGLPVSPYRAGSTGPKTEDDEQDFANAKQLWQFQSMLYVSSDVLQRWVLDAYRNSRELQPEGKNGDNFLAMLKQQDNNRHPLPSDPAKRSYGQIDRYWFWKLDYILWEKRAELFAKKAHKDAVDSYTFRQNRSIEHLHPQTSDRPWGENDLNSFGNLAMISAGLNSQQSNHGVAEKFGRLKDQLRNGRQKLESIKLLLMFNKAEREESGWTEEASKKHGEEMIKILESYYETAQPENPVSPGQ